MLLTTKEKKVAMNGGKKTPVPKDFLEKAAYHRWQARGCPLGDPLTDWLEAERELDAMMGGAKRKWWRPQAASIPFLARIFEQS